MSIINKLPLHNLNDKTKDQQQLKTKARFIVELMELEGIPLETILEILSLGIDTTINKLLLRGY